LRQRCRPLGCCLGGYPSHLCCPESAHRLRRPRPTGAAGNAATCLHALAIDPRGMQALLAAGGVEEAVGLVRSPDGQLNGAAATLLNAVAMEGAQGSAAW
jgi:hypothetical protein